MKPFWVYILQCADGSYYTGHTDDLEVRIGQHQTGACGGYTAKRLPVNLVWSQECTTREEALAAELQIKGWSRKKKEAMIRGDWNEVSRLAKSKSVHASTGSARPDLPRILGATNTIHHDTTATVRPDPSTSISPDTTATVRPDPSTSISPDTTATVRPGASVTVRPELVEGTNGKHLSKDENHE
jgi:predicted GIY-YIG superfamily endonuclease